MDIRILIETEFEDGNVQGHDLGRLSRPLRMACGEGIGLILEDARAILGRLQKVMILDQLAEISQASLTCPGCNAQRQIHDYRTRKLDALYGRIEVRVPRIRPCCCQLSDEGTNATPQSLISCILPDRSTPEFLRLHADLGSRHSFREAARIMETFLPCAPQSHVTVRNRLGRVAMELESQAAHTEPKVEEKVDASAATTLFLDGAHIPCRPEYQKRHLDVLVGKTAGSNGSRRFGMVKDSANSPLALIREELTQAGWRPGALLTVLTDGEPALPNLVRLAVRQPVSHILDWWHITMRIRHVEMAVRGLVQSQDSPANQG